jgi:formiminoglutamase
MAAQGPPVGPDKGEERPAICISNADGTCPKEWITTLADCLNKVFEKDVSINNPFKGGSIIRSHAKELPWIQLELSREPFFPNKEKTFRLGEALKDWCKILP